MVQFLGLPISARACNGSASRRGRSVEQRPAERQFFLAYPVAKKTELPNAYESAGQDMEEEAANELDRIQRHRAVLIAASVVFSLERHPAPVH